MIAHLRCVRVNQVHLNVFFYCFLLAFKMVKNNLDVLSIKKYISNVVIDEINW